MNFGFLVVDEAALDRVALQAAALRQDAAAVVSAVRAQGGPWGSVDLDPESYAAAFRALGRQVGQEDLLADLAFAGSPFLVLTGLPGPWRLGYFEARLVRHLQPVLNNRREALEAELAEAGARAEDVGDRFLQALDEAFLRQRAVAIVHGG